MALAISNGKNANGAATEAIAATLSQTHDCELWTQYRPNHSPKDHDDMSAQQLATEVQQQLLVVQKGMFDLQSEFAQWKREQANKDDSLTARRRAMDYLFQFLLALVAAAVALIAARLLPFFSLPNS